MFYTSLTTFITLAAFVSATPTPTSSENFVTAFARAPSCTFPTPPKTSSLTSARTITGTFDGGNIRFDRGKGACGGQKEGGEKETVFLLSEGAVLKNVIIGANQAEGVHCLGSCTLENVWFEDVCEDAVTIKQKSGISTIRGGGAKNASDKVIQHNGGGTVVIKDYCVQNFGKLYRSCGNCSSQQKRSVIISNVIATNGKLIAGVNSNFGDVATITKSSLQLSSVSSMCDTFKATVGSGEPTKLTSNKANSSCKF
ncbi:pectate lyase-domain-containing protein [Pterulicium gracile]|uniref:Pectate lyase n=1 Tax=Pterulicium gracile TaxID=1884261 RepID=A0A5C3Q319_9AGAR|nr:pectate lyase-domain-containing protein [Pterula gracilis]